MRRTYNIEVDCANCANIIEAKAEKLKGVSSVTISFVAQKMVVDFEDGFDESKVLEEIIKKSKKVEPDFKIVCEV